MSATALAKPRYHAGAMPEREDRISFHAGRRMLCKIQFRRQPRSRLARSLLVSDSPGFAASKAGLIAALSLLLAGCGGLRSGSKPQTTPPASSATRSTPDPTPAARPAESSSKATQARPRTIQTASDSRPQPAPPARGAEGLVALSTKGPQNVQAASAGAPARASEKTPPPADPPDLKPPTKQSTGALTNPSVNELVVKGPPRQAPQPRDGMKALAWLGVVLGGAALAVLTRLFVLRRAKPLAASSAGKDDLQMPPELRLKESVLAPEEPAAAEKL